MRRDVHPISIGSCPFIAFFSGFTVWYGFPRFLSREKHSLLFVSEGVLSEKIESYKMPFSGTGLEKIARREECDATSLETDSGDPVFPVVTLSLAIPPALVEAKRSSAPLRQVAVGKEGMVVTAHPLATQVGADVLRQGGNAVDAAWRFSLL